MVALKHVGKGGGVIHALHSVQKLSRSVQKPGKSDSLPSKAKQEQVYMLISPNRANKKRLDLCNSELVWG